MPKVVQGAFDRATSGQKPVVFDILGPDRETSLLPEGIKMVLHVNPRQMSITMTREVTRMQTRGGYVEQHWGDVPSNIQFEMATGGFMRLYAGLSNVTSGRDDQFGGSRRQTIAYDTYLDMLSLFMNNGSIVDANGQVVLQGIIKVTFDEGTWYGWFSDFSVSESAEVPHMFNMSASMVIEKEVVSLRSQLGSYNARSAGGG